MFIFDIWDNYLSSLFGYERYPKSHVTPHFIPNKRTTICDYSGQPTDKLIIKCLPYEIKYGILCDESMYETATFDCYEYCKKIKLFPISMEFLIKNKLDGLYYARSGECKNYRILSGVTMIENQTTGKIVFKVTDGKNIELVEFKSFCEFNKLNYKKMLELLEKELATSLGLTFAE